MIKIDWKSMQRKSDKPFYRKTLVQTVLLYALFIGTIAVLGVVGKQEQTIRGKAAVGDCTTSPYDAAVLADKPIGYWQLSDADTVVKDCSIGKKHPGSYVGNPTTDKLSNGDPIKVFNGSSQYAQIPDSDDLSVNKTGVLTIEAWMRPDTLQFPRQEAEGYVHWMGKGKFGQDEYVARIYSKTNSAGRPNRISGYVFNLPGGLGAGSYFQDAITAGEWIHYAVVINNNEKSGAYPSGYTKVFKNGVQRDQDSLKEYNIVPQNGTEPFRIGTRDMNSFFKGAIGKVAMYDYELTPAKLLAHYQARSGSSLTPSLVTPTLYCLGSCPTGTVAPSATVIPPSQQVSVSPTQSVPTVTPPSEIAPTAAPCEGTTSVQKHTSKHHNIGQGFLKRLLGFLTWLLNLLEGLLQGRTAPPPVSGDTPPCPSTPTPTESAPTEAVSPSAAPTSSSLVPSVAPTTDPAGSTNSCALPNYPNPICTGVPAGTSLATVNGDVTLSTPGQVYEGKHVTGSIFVAAANVTIRKSQIDGNVVNHQNGDPKFTIEDSTVGKEGSCTKDTAIDESNYTATRVKVLGHGDGFGDSGVGNILIQDSFVKLCASDASYHSDGVQGYLGGTNVVIRHNTIDQRPAAIGATAPVFMSDQSKDADVQDNLLAGGSETIRVYYFGGKDIVKNNRVVDKSWVYGPVSSSCSNITWSGNTLVTIDANYKVTSTVGPLACAN